MSDKLRRLSGKDVVTILRRFGFVICAQRGSHVKLRRFSPKGEKQTILIPLHDELDIGTLRSIYRHAARYVPQEMLRPYFYRD